MGALAGEIGVNEMTLRKFLDHEDRKPYPETWALYRAWYARQRGAVSPPPPSALAEKATRALQLFDEGRALLAEVVQAVQQLPPTPEQRAQIAAQDAPMPSARPRRGAKTGTGDTSA